MKTRSPVKRLCFDAMAVACALILSYLEAVLPINIVPIPGFKLGLANIAVMLVFFNVSPLDAAGVSAARILLQSILFGSPISAVFSISGAVLSYIFLLLVRGGKGRWFSYIGISVGAATCHNIGQMIAASVMFSDTGVFYYLPWLLGASLVAGLAVGILIELLEKRISSALKTSQKKFRF